MKRLIEKIYMHWKRGTLLDWFECLLLFGHAWHPIPAFLDPPAGINEVCPLCGTTR